MEKRIPARALIQCILCARCKKYATATGGGICAACALTTERDQLRAEVERLRVERGGLETLIVGAHFRAFGSRHYAYVDPRSTCDLLVADITITQHERDAALAASPDEHARRIKAEALRATAKELENLRDHIQNYIAPDDARDDIRRVCWNRAKDLREKANRLEAANG